MEGMDDPQLPPHKAGAEFEPITEDERKFEEYLLDMLIPLCNECSLAQKARQNHLLSLHPDEIAFYSTNEPVFYYRSQLLGLAYNNEVEVRYQLTRGKLLQALDEALDDLGLRSPGFDYRATFEGVLEQLFEGVEGIYSWHHVRDHMIRLYPQQLMMAADYFSGMQRAASGSWVVANLPEHSRGETVLIEQEECARELKENLELLIIGLPDLQRRIQRKSYGRGEQTQFNELLEGFDIARWNFAQVALGYVKGQIYETLLAEEKRLEPGSESVQQ